MRRRLDLLFPPGQNCGFTPVGMAAFADLRPAAVVRELVQNSLDAAREIDTTPAIVRFRTASVPTKELPSIRSYRTAFMAAARHQKTLNGGTLSAQAQIVVDTIDDTLKRKHQTVLFVSDNGIGMNKSRMGALLADGISIQSGTRSTGSYGNGHSVPIPASDLRYVLYGSVTESGRRVASGHAVLASHRLENGSLSSGHGLLTMSTKREIMDGKYEFAPGRHVPPLLTREINQIRSEYRHGSVVALPAFNNFREPDESLWAMVAKAVACNFFSAIHDGDLVVVVDESFSDGSRQPMVLNAQTLSNILDDHKEERRSRSFLSGGRASEAYHALTKGQLHRVVTQQGSASVRLHMDVAGSTRIDLCRNGMWITNALPGFQGHFTTRRPFHALILVDSNTGGTLHELLRKAEGPLHDHLAMKSVLSGDRSALRAALSEIRDFLKKEVPDVGTEAFRPDDFLVLDFGDESSGRRSQRNPGPSFWGTPTPVTGLALPGWQRDFQEPGSSINTVSTGGKGRRQRPPRFGAETKRRRPALRPFFHAVSVPVTSARRRLHIHSVDTCKDAEVRLVIDENLDATCEPRRGDMPPLHLTKVEIDGRPVSSDRLVIENGHVVGVRLGDLDAGSAMGLDVEFALPDGLDGLDFDSLAFRVEMHETVREAEEADPK